MDKTTAVHRGARGNPKQHVVNTKGRKELRGEIEASGGHHGETGLHEFIKHSGRKRMGGKHFRGQKEASVSLAWE